MGPALRMSTASQFEEKIYPRIIFRRTRGMENPAHSPRASGAKEYRIPHSFSPINRTVCVERENRRVQVGATVSYHMCSPVVVERLRMLSVFWCCRLTPVCFRIPRSDPLSAPKSFDVLFTLHFFTLPSRRNGLMFLFRCWLYCFPLYRSSCRVFHQV